MQIREALIQQAPSLTLLRAAADEIARLDAELKSQERMAALWYYAMDEAPLEFERIVTTVSPARWMDEIAKLRAGACNAT